MAKAKKKFVKAKVQKKTASKAQPQKSLKKPPKKSAAKSAAKTKAVAKSSPSRAKPSLSIPANYFTPLDDRLLVQRIAVELRTPGGLYIPDSVASAERPTQGKVVAVGRGHLDKKGRLRPLDVQKGDTVMFTAFAGSEITIENQQLLVLREQDILAIMND